MVNKYILQRNCKNLILSLLIATVVMVPSALALPTYLTPLNTLYGPGLSCGTCHINPAGGGPRTAYGTLFENQTIHFTDPTAALTAIGSPTPQVAGTTASRTIENGVLADGNSTNVTVVISNNVTQALSLKETIPPGWVLTRGIDDADQFKASTNEWLWLTVTGGATKTVKYGITVPVGTVPGMYNISGAVSTANTSIVVTGDQSIQVTNSTVVDTISPTTVLNGVVEGGIFTGNVTITLNATDNVGGSGVNITTYSLNGASETTYSGPFMVNNPGQNTITYGSIDNAGNVENVNTINFTINSVPVGTFGFVAAPLSETVNIGENATYNLTLTNTGNAAATYTLVADEPSNAAVTLDQNNLTVDQGNVAVVGMTVVSSTAGTYVVNVTATDNMNNSAMVTTTTNVIRSILTIENLMSVPSSAISSANPAIISANVIMGASNITKVEFGIIDTNNILGKGSGTVILASDNSSGLEGSYSPEAWPATYMTIGNVAATDFVSVTIGDNPEFANVRGMFKANNTSNSAEAIISFNRTTGNISNITDFTSGEPLTVENANSTFQATTANFANGNVTFENVSDTAFTLFDMTGNDAVNNPSITVIAVPNGNYEVYAMATDESNNTTSQLIGIDTNPVSTSTSHGGSGGGTYPTFTQTPVPTVSETAVVPTISPTVTEVSTPATTPEQTISPTETISVPTQTKPAPGIGIVVAIGIIGTIYIIRKRNRQI